MRNLDVPTFVYGLRDPRTMTVFYIGITKWNLKARLGAHRSDYSSAAYHRIAEIEGCNLACEILEIVDCASRTIARSWERYLIRQFPGLLNRDRS